MKLILASRSPRRAELLTRIGLTFEIRAADVDESPLSGEDPADYVVRLARAKAEAVASSLGMTPDPVGAASDPVGAASDPVGATSAERSSAQANEVRPRSRISRPFATGRSLPRQEARSLPRQRGEESRSGDRSYVVLGADTAVVLDGRVLGKPADAAAAVEMVLALSGRSHRVMSGVAVCGPRGTLSRCATTEVRFRVVERGEAEAYARTGEGADKAGGYGIQGIGGIFAESIRGSYSAVVGLPLAETEQLLRDSGLDTWRERTHG